MLRLRAELLPHITFRIGDGTKFSLWHDPWHQLGPLISRYPLEPNVTGTHSVDRLQRMIVDGSWRWPAIAGMGYGEITHDLPHIHGGQGSIQWNGGNIRLTNGVAYKLFQPRGLKVEWSSLLLGPLKIHRNTFILWLAILGHLSTLDKPWLHHINGTCSLCSGGYVETHQHLLFDCQYSPLCLASIRRRVRFPWPFRDWMTGIRWISSRWRGKHVVNAAYWTLLASVVYHIWQERNRRQFQNEERTPMVLGRCIVKECRQRIISDNLPNSISTCALYRIWKIPWVHNTV
ncbi:UNVERIFIED_CONTAM: hypothetical protein Sradi_3865300 [Sesamum radiatum]|uniref:Reverse transcriptase zinc-binding domain-containing protein n=1 Tax=Sesamum radiatum TaxID=300843 RepID=A0AAW2Q2J9_SESRA